MNKIRFTPTLSFDGIAIIAGIIYICFWGGGIDKEVKNTSTIVANHTIQIQQTAKEVWELKAIFGKM